MPHVPPPMIRMGLVFEGGGCVEGIVIVVGGGWVNSFSLLG